MPGPVCLDPGGESDHLPSFTLSLPSNLTSDHPKVASIILIPILELKELKKKTLKLRDAQQLIQGHSAEEELGGYESAQWIWDTS